MDILIFHSGVDNSKSSEPVGLGKSGQIGNESLRGD